MRMLFGALLFACATMLPGASAWAWGAEGHQITGYVAEHLLTTETRIRIKAFLPTADLAQESTWLDEQRLSLKHKIPGSEKWHYVNLPVCGTEPLSKVCPDGNCAPVQIEKYRKILADPKSTREDKAFAFRVLMHLVGDIHQPLHAADNHDRGGNDVSIGKGQNNLHREWDSGLVKRLVRGNTPQDYANQLLARYSFQVLQTWAAGTAGEWAEESRRVAAKTVYGNLPGFSCAAPVTQLDRLPEDYREMAGAVIDEQLVKSGVRIAFVLNQALSAKP